MKYLLLLFSLIVSHAISAAQELPFTHYTAEKEVNPLPSSNIPMTYQDRMGYIWFVIYSSGLARYNGNSLTLYTDADGLPGLDIREVAEDSSGRLWVASEAGLSVSSRPLHEYGTADQLVFLDSIDAKPLFRLTVAENRMCVDHTGLLWLGTRASGIIRYRITAEGKLEADTVSTSATRGGQHRDVRSLCLRRDGLVWAALGGGVLVAYNKDGHVVETVGPEQGIPSSDSDVIREIASGRMIGGTVVGKVWSLQGQQGNRVVENIDLPITARVTSIVEDSKHRVWISSEGTGVAVLEPRGDYRHITIRNGLLSDLVTNIMEDYEGNIWASQIGGVSKLRSDFEAFLSYTSYSREGIEPYLSNTGVNTVVPESRRNPYQGMWVATSGGGITFIGRDHTIRNYGIAHGLKSDWVNGITIDRGGRLWIGSANGINCISLRSSKQAPNGQQRRMINLPAGDAVLTGYGYRTNTIYSCDVFPFGEQGTSAEAVWFAAYQGIYLLAEEQWVVFRTSAGLPETYFTSILVDPAGFVWVGTRDAGLYRSRKPITGPFLRKLNSRDFQRGPDGGTFGLEVLEPVFDLVWDVSRGAPSNQMESMVFLDGLLWIGNPEGLVAVNPNDLSTVVHLTPADGLPGNDVTSLAYSPKSRTLWLGTNGGIAEVDPTARKVLRSVTKRDGIVDNEVWWYGSIRVNEEGGVYFGTAKGLALFNPDKEETNQTPPRVRFEAVQQHEDLSSNSISFRFAGLSFADESRVRYRVFLEGYEDGWSEETKDITARYLNLPAFFVNRSFTFKVMACNNDGIWNSAPLAHSFEVEPPWWFRWWFTAINIGVLVGLSFTFLHFRTLKLRQRSQQLERIVEERTEEIRQKADHIRRQADELSEKNVELEEKNAEILRTQEQLIVQEKLASLGALTAGVAHEIKNPLNFVNNFSEVSVEIARELREDLESVRGAIDPSLYKRLEDSCIDLADNSAKINEHGKRADGIVKGMLEHSRGQTGQRELTQINALLDEYATLAYHGLKAQEPDCNLRFEKKFDESAKPLEVFPGDLSRAFLNIVNNACYSVCEKQKKSGRVFSPVVTLTTLDTSQGIEIRVLDNGTGIPKDIREKIFNPFFTTKPTGKGTGLGLSLTHDIIVKQHGGRIEVDSVEGEFAEFRIYLPGNKQKKAPPPETEAPGNSTGRPKSD